MINYINALSIIADNKNHGNNSQFLNTFAGQAWITSVEVLEVLLLLDSHFVDIGSNGYSEAVAGVEYLYSIVFISHSPHMSV